MSAGNAAADAVRARIAGDMMQRRPTPREPLDDAPRHPRRGPRPTDRAQWDEIHGCWVEWDDDDDLWVHIVCSGRHRRSHAPGGA